MFCLGSSIEIGLREGLVMLELGPFALGVTTLLNSELIERGKHQRRTLGELDITNTTGCFHASLEFVHSVNPSLALRDRGGEVDGGVHFCRVGLPGENKAVEAPRLIEFIIDAVEESILPARKIVSTDMDRTRPSNLTFCGSGYLSRS